MASKVKLNAGVREDQSPSRLPANQRQLISPGRNSCLLLNEKNYQSSGTTLQLRKLRSGVGMDTVRELEQVGSWHTPQKLRVMGEDEVTKRIAAQKRRLDAQRRHRTQDSTEAEPSDERAGPTNWMSNTVADRQEVVPPPCEERSTPDHPVPAKQVGKSHFSAEITGKGEVMMDLGAQILGFFLGRPEPVRELGDHGPVGKETQKESVGLGTQIIPNVSSSSSRDELRCCQPFPLPKA
mmetsp:Transcript_39223/g.61142  ORF Transcript_39223/g.61142 Transcript_39223/m.61142 type:complete len:238 (-) Transcript_39223:320-1033(-)